MQPNTNYRAYLGIFKDAPVFALCSWVIMFMGWGLVTFDLAVSSAILATWGDV